MRRHRSPDPTIDIVSPPRAEYDSAEIADAAKEAYEDEDRMLRLTALGLLAVAITTGGAVAATKHYIKKHKEQ